MSASPLVFDAPSAHALTATQDIDATAAASFAVISEVENWPVWLSFLRSVRIVGDRPSLEVGADIAIRSRLPGEEEELFEVDRFLTNHHLSLVGAYSCRRRIDIRLEQKSSLTRVTVRLDYPTYGGVMAALLDRLTRRRRLQAELADGLVHLKGLVEFKRSGDVLLDDF
jgi:uncharacterized membrane protein